ncbi:hypothetical protein ACCI51_11265 [Microbulbifer echini]|uniref:DUF2846 domain-containing protein n=1 Tax=Microbulbifer echini TaxID=1529067 RepID=A0ABV4NPE7_9GAMM
MYQLEPGIYRFTAENESVGFYRLGLDLELQAGKTYYLKWFVGDLSSLETAVYGGIGVGVASYDYKFIRLPSEVAMPEIRTLSYSGPQ